MYIFVDTEEQKVLAAPKMGQVAKLALEHYGHEIFYGDPVASALKAIKGRGVIMNVEAAFLSIAESDNGAAQELAGKMASAVKHWHDNQQRIEEEWKAGKDAKK